MKSLGESSDWSMALHLFAELPQPDRCQLEFFFFLGGETVEDIKQACISLYMGFYMVLMVEIGVLYGFYMVYIKIHPI